MPKHLVPIRLFFLCCLFVCHAALAEIYIYKGPNGERLISDRPPHATENYKLVMKRDNMANAGHILANRAIAAGGPAKFSQHINAASSRFDVDPALVEAVIQVESGFNPNAVSRKGATGLMQLMKQTAQHYDVRDRFNPQQNIYAGVEHLSDLMTRYNNQIPLVLAAYNAGPTAVERYRGVPPYPETKRYITKVLGYHDKYKIARYGGR